MVKNINYGCTDITEKYFILMHHDIIHVYFAIKQES